MSNALDVFRDTQPLTTPRAQVDCEAVRGHVEMLHRLAAGLDGKLILCGIGEDLPTQLRHFSIGDEAGMLATADELCGKRYNVYASLSVMHSGLDEHAKGTLKDAVAILGTVADFDDASAAEWCARLPVAPDFVYETSAGHFQCGFLFRDPLSVERASAICTRLHAYAECDHCTKNPIQLYRLPGTLNFPDARKRARGRSPDPQPVRVIEAWDGHSTNGDKLDSVLPALPIAEQVATNAAISGEGFDAEATFAKLPEQTRKLIVEGPEPGADRSGKFLRVVAELKGSGWPQEAVISLFEKYPEGVAAKYAGRIPEETERVYHKNTKPNVAPEPSFTPQVPATASFAAIGAAFSPASASAPTLRIPADLARDIQAGPIDPETQQRFTSWLTRGGRMPLKEALRAWIGGFHPALFPGLRRLSEIALGREPPWLVADWIPRGGIVMMVGDPGAGKTPIAVDIGLSIATGKSWQGSHKVTSGPVAFLAVENPASTAGRVMAAQQHRGDTDAAPFYLYGEPVNFLQPSDIDKVLSFCRGIEAETGQRVACIVVDTYANATAGADEDKARDANLFIASVVRLRSEIGATVLFTHHFGKDKARGARGSTVLNAAADTVLEVSHGAVKGTKQRDGDVDKLRASFAIRPVQIGTLEREDGTAEPVMNVALIWQGEPDFVPVSEPRASTADAPQLPRAGTDARKLYTLLQDISRGGMAPFEEDARAAFGNEHHPGKAPKRVGEAFSRAVTALMRGKLVCKVEDGGRLRLKVLGPSPSEVFPQEKAL